MTGTHAGAAVGRYVVKQLDADWVGERLKGGGDLIRHVIGKD
ncbi:hypothetical protein [Schaalia sp. JY-X159]|jgi:hypothetical protein|nr:hypothetical protein [Schaalia sp. JY-X159]